jgi:hypothetical protein
LGLEPKRIAALNDDRFGRCLDQLFLGDCGSLALAVAAHAVTEFQVELDELHNDSTTVTFSGDYADAAQEERRRGQTRLAITWGHNKDHRPDLKQLLFILTVSKDGGVPVYFQAKSGNVADDQTHLVTWEMLCKLIGGRISSTWPTASWPARRTWPTSMDMAEVPHRAAPHSNRGSPSSARRWPEAGFVGDGLRQVRRQGKTRGSVPREPSRQRQVPEGYRLVWYHSSRRRS